MSGHPRVAIVVNSPPSGVLGPRVKAFATGLTGDFRVEVLWRESARPQSILAFYKGLRRCRPDVLYLVDLGYPAVFASLMYRQASSCALVIETGDPLAELLWASGRVGKVGRLGIRGYERVVLRRADRVVVRGSGLREYLAGLGVARADTVPDGVDTRLFRPMDVADLRQALDLEGCVSIGVMGSLNWSKRLQWGYGSELIQALALLRDLPVRGIVVGEGPGRAMLERQAVARGVRERIRFVEHVPHNSLPAYVNAMDICLSTQTNDWVGRSRTTAKLPLFLSCGRFVLASRVGEAARLLPEEMLVDYGEGFDPSYPERLARRIEGVANDPQLLRLGEKSRQIAESQFDYDLLVPKVAGLLRSVLNHRASRH
jgi:glycosyltransferase involved in cell wall biosynthesis